MGGRSRLGKLGIFSSAKKLLVFWHYLHHVGGKLSWIAMHFSVTFILFTLIQIPLVLRFLPSSSLLLSPPDFMGTWLLIYWSFQASQSLSILNPAISAHHIRVHKNNPPYGCLNWNHFYFQFGWATLPYKHTLAHPQELVPQTLVFTCPPPLNALVLTLSFLFSLFFGFSEASAPATSDCHLNPPPPSCFFFLSISPSSPMHVSAPCPSAFFNLHALCLGIVQAFTASALTHRQLDLFPVSL